MITGSQFPSPRAVPCLAAIAALVSAALSLSGCGGGGGGSTNTGGSNGTATRLRYAMLSGRQTVPATASMASGAATVELDAAKKTIRVAMETVGTFSSPVTMVHVHVGGWGQNGPHVLDVEPRLTTPMTSRSTRHGGGSGPVRGFPGTLEVTLNAADFTPQPSVRVNTFDDLIEAIAAGNAYVNIHTQNNPDGELRGQITEPVVTMRATLTGQQAVPAVSTQARGSAVVVLDAARQKISMTLDTTGPFSSPVTGVHVHHGLAGQTGPHIWDVFPTVPHTHPMAAATRVHPGGLPERLTVDLIPETFTSHSAEFPSFADAFSAIRMGKAYINVHTQTHVAAELRGQIAP